MFLFADATSCAVRVGHSGVTMPSHVRAVANLNRINQIPRRSWLGTRACSRTSCATSGQDGEPALGDGKHMKSGWLRWEPINSAARRSPGACELGVAASKTGGVCAQPVDDPTNDLRQPMTFWRVPGRRVSTIPHLQMQNRKEPKA